MTLAASPSVTGSPPSIYQFSVARLRTSSPALMSPRSDFGSLRSGWRPNARSRAASPRGWRPRSPGATLAALTRRRGTRRSPGLAWRLSLPCERPSARRSSPLPSGYRRVGRSPEPAGDNEIPAVEGVGPRALMPEALRRRARKYRPDGQTHQSATGFQSTPPLR